MRATESLHILPPVPGLMIWPVAGLAMAFAALVGLDSGSVVPVYYPLVLLVGALGWTRRQAIAAALSAHDSPFWRMVLAGYLAVVAEETLAGLLHGLAEGAGPLGLIRSAGQFILFNLFAFTGIILSLAIWRSRLALGRWDLFLAAGGWGLFAEGSLQAALGNPLAGGMLLLPNMAVYAVILWPLTLSCPPARLGQRQRPVLLRLALIWGLAFVLSLPAVATVSALRAAHGDWFPPCAYIAC